MVETHHLRTLFMLFFWIGLTAPFAAGAKTCDSGDFSVPIEKLGFEVQNDHAYLYTKVGSRKIYYGCHPDGDYRPISKSIKGADIWRFKVRGEFGNGELKVTLGGGEGEKRTIKDIMVYSTDGQPLDIGPSASGAGASGWYLGSSTSNTETGIKAQLDEKSVSGETQPTVPEDEDPIQRPSPSSEKVPDQLEPEYTAGDRINPNPRLEEETESSNVQEKPKPKNQEGFWTKIKRRIKQRWNEIKRWWLGDSEPDPKPKIAPEPKLASRPKPEPKPEPVLEPRPAPKCKESYCMTIDNLTFSFKWLDDSISEAEKAYEAISVGNGHPRKIASGSTEQGMKWRLPTLGEFRKIAAKAHERYEVTGKCFYISGNAKKKDTLPCACVSKDGKVTRKEIDRQDAVYLAFVSQRVNRIVGSRTHTGSETE
uniref:Uncharacterized protein n=1 Tax=Candidatus Kentrum sp. FW TaxID=2126338 RepID=A0A450T0S1_9GAMM|nr:MAG: hypothetical protein BECKFW1821A_GA0114235_10975 [Candidatus Kentron sp. FW]